MNRVYTIQYLRAIAALAVVIVHASKRVEDSLADSVNAFLVIGHGGVDLFFVISGFIMWSITKQRPTDPGNFWIKRLVRIVPTYWIAVLAWTAFMLLAGYNWLKITPEHVLLSLGFVPHYSPTFPEDIWPVLIPGWTLNYEMFFYLVFGLTLFAPAKSRLLLLCGSMLALVAFGFVLDPQQAWAVTYTSPLLLEFMGGVLVAELWMRAPGGVLRNAIVLGVGLFLFIFIGPSVDAEDYASRTLYFGAPAILIASGFVGLGTRVPHLPLLEKLGDASYAIYLFHLFLIVPMAEVWIRLPQIHGTLGAVGFIVTALVLASGAGLYFFKHLEQPLQRFFTGLFVTNSRRPGLADR